MKKQITVPAGNPQQGPGRGFVSLADFQKEFEKQNRPDAGRELPKTASPRDNKNPVVAKLKETLHTIEFPNLKLSRWSRCEGEIYAAFKEFVAMYPSLPGRMKNTFREKIRTSLANGIEFIGHRIHLEEELEASPAADHVKYDIQSLRDKRQEMETFLSSLK